ncbi:hypothetical protein BDV93DRAFT_554496 [Ceratobasidium sp. AG-I]|nr:hypothetical protein BDV93DRAFT_554496 [Ceratobasidium sp. AG-I]
MYLAVELKVSFTNATWTGESTKDIRTLYTRMIFKLTGYLLNTLNAPLMVAISVRATLEGTLHYLSPFHAQKLRCEVPQYRARDLTNDY